MIYARPALGTKTRRLASIPAQMQSLAKYQINEGKENKLASVEFKASFIERRFWGDDFEGTRIPSIVRQER